MLIDSLSILEELSLGLIKQLHQIIETQHTPMETAQDNSLIDHLSVQSIGGVLEEKNGMITTSTEKFHSADFDKTPPAVTVHIRSNYLNGI